MKISGIIAEYNPFHNGHKYQLEEVRKNSDIIIVIMSSSFTQRGTPAILDKFTRAEIAIKNGANLVLELPVIYSSSNAEYFSKGAIFILNSLGIIDNLYFGSENKLEDITSINEKIKENKDIFEENLKINLSLGHSYLVSREKSMTFLNEDEINILKKPNNILGFEYIKALEYFNSNIKPQAILRKDVDHGSSITTNNFSSASNIRDLYYNKNFTDIIDFLPKESLDALKNINTNNFNNYFDIIKFLIIQNKINYEKYFDYENGLENRFLKFIDSYNIDHFIYNISTKRYTKSRISRLLNNILLDIDSDFIKSSFNSPYVRVLAMDVLGAKALKSSNVDIINKFSKINNITDPVLKRIAEKEVFATNLYNQFTNKIVNQDFLKSPIFIKKELRD